MSEALIVIGSTPVFQDAQGRFRLNDLHQASGGEKRHQPSDFFRLASTRELIVELARTPPGIPGGPLLIVNDGRGNGTYVCRELVYAYAMWISAAFHLKVIRAFDAVATGRQVLALPQDYEAALEELLKKVRENRLLSERVAQDAPKVEGFTKFLDAKDTFSLRDTAKSLNIREQELIARLIEDKRVFRVPSGELRAYAEECAAGRFTHRNWTAKHSKKPKAGVQVRVTTAGLDWLSGRFARQQDAAQ